MEEKASSPLIPPPSEIDLEAGGGGEQLQCRICLETDGRRRSDWLCGCACAGRDFIAPCKCKGTSKYVHRDCLDHWRAVKEGFAFSHCTTCKAPYYLRVHSHTDRKWRTLKFRFFVTRDILFIFALVQIVITALAYLVHFIDGYQQYWLRTAWGFDNEVSFYYICGALLFFALLGLSGCFITCYDRRVRNDLAQPCRELCLCCCQPGMCADCHLPGTLCMWTDCTTCFEGCATTAGECGGCLGGAGEAGLPLLLIMGVIVLGLFTVIGIFYSVLVATMVGQRIWQRHYHILAKRMLTKEMVAKDKAQAAPASHDEVDLDELLDDPELEKLHAERIAALKKEAEKREVLKRQGHGEYREITEGDFLGEVTGSEKVICHFYHREFYRCKIMDKHLKALAPVYEETKFVKLDAENAPFFVAKLAIKTLPCVLLFKKGIAVDRLVGFQDLGSKDDFSTRALENILKMKGIIDEKKKDDDDDDEESESKNRRVRSSTAQDSDSDGI